MRMFCRIHDLERQQFVIFVSVDGTSENSSKLSSGPIGKFLQNLDKNGFDKKRKVVEFQPIEGSETVKNFEGEINHDAETSILWVKAVMSGK